MSDDLGNEISKALAALRPAPRPGFETRLVAAALTPHRRSWIVPAIGGAVCAAFAVVLLVLHGGKPEDTAAPAGGFGPASIETLDAYQGVLDGRTDGLDLADAQRARVDQIVASYAAVAKQRAGEHDDGMRELAVELAKPDADAKRAQQLLARVTAADAARATAALAARSELRALLTDAQRAQIERRRVATVPGPVVPLQKANLVLETAPTGATVTLDGNVLGETPMRVEIVPGQHAVLIDRAGSIPWRSKLDLAAGETQSVRVVLDEIPTTSVRSELTIRVSPAGADVTIDGKAVGKSPVRVTLLPGRHVVRVTKAGYAAGRYEVDTKASQPQALEVSLEPPDSADRVDPLPPDIDGLKNPFADPKKQGFLRVTSDPWAYVTIDGRGRRDTPAKVTLAPGRYTVTLSRDGYKTMTKTVTITAGSTTNLTVSLDAQ